MIVEQKIWNAAFVGAFLANSMTSLGQQMMHVLVSLYADSLGATSTLVGFAVSAFAYTALGLRVISGPAIDAFSKKKLLAASVLVIATSYAMFAVSSNIALLIAGRLLQGVGVAFTTTCCLAMAADALPPNRLNTGIGFF